MNFRKIFAYPARFRCFAAALAAWTLAFAAAGMFLLPATCPADPVQPEVGAIRVQVTGGPEDAPEMGRIARRLIYLEEGKPFSDEAFSRSVDALRRSGLFAEIHIPDPDWSKAAIDLVFRLTPYARIKNIRIRGGFPLLEAEIRNVMSIEAGDACVPEKISAQAEKIESLFSAEGYIRPRVSLSRSTDSGDGHCIVDVNIDKGAFYRVAAVRFEGNRRFSSTRLKMRLDTWQSSLLFGGPSRFVEKALEQDTKSLRQFYYSKGYPEAEIESELTKNPETGEVRIRFVISEGPRYRVFFAGNDAFWDFTLKKDLVLFSEGNRNGFGLRKSIRNIRQRYREAGFLDMQIDTEEQNLQESGLPVKRIRFAIREGPRYIVDSVSISGSRAFDAETIRKQMLTAPPAVFHEGAYVPEILTEDIRAIEALYTRTGYADASVKDAVETRPAPETEEKMLVSVTLRIAEGPQTIVREVFIEEESPIPEERAVEELAMKPGTPFRDYRVASDQNALAAAISEKGYPHVSVDPGVEVSPDRTAARLTYKVDPGPRVRMGEVFFTGNFHTRQRVLDREIEIRAGEPFSLSRMLASQRNIRSINAVDTARFETFGLEERAGRVDMIAKIQEIRPYFVELATGYDTQRLFYVHAAAGNRNLFGLNKQGRISLEWSQIGYRADLDYSEPKFLGTQISAISNLFAEKREELNQNFGVRTYGASQGFSRQITSRLSASLNFRYESRDQYRTDEQPIPAEEASQYRPRTLLAASPGLAYTSTDAFLRPSRGVRASATVDLSRGLDNSLDDFLKYRLDARYYYSPLYRLTLAFHGRLGYIDPYGENQRIPEDQLFFLGGTANIRGFDENRLRFDEKGDPVGGRTSLLASAEARYDLGMNFELAAFYDTGAVRDPLRDAGSGDFRSSAGLALRYITPIGPIGGMYGWKLDPRPGESPGAFHFAIGYTF